MCGGCGECERCRKAAYMRQWWAKLSPERKRAAIAGRDPDLVREQDRLKQDRRRRYGTPEQLRKIAARNEVRLARMAGALKPQPCEVCGASRVDAHHDDYDRPLDVRWLCRAHHNELHGIGLL